MLPNYLKKDAVSADICWFYEYTAAGPDGNVKECMEFKNTYDVQIQDEASEFNNLFCLW